jgi:hypothetical protein
MAAENKILNNAIVKIGNAQSEEHRLTVYHSDNTSVSIYGYGLYMSRTNSYIRPSNDGSQILAIGTDNNTWNYVALDTNYFTVSTNASEHFRITNTGNVGIGTTSPNYKLDVNGEAQLGYINFEYSSNYAGVRLETMVQTVIGYTFTTMQCQAPLLHLSLIVICCLPQEAT